MNIVASCKISKITPAPFGRDKALQKMNHLNGRFKMLSVNKPSLNISSLTYTRNTNFALRNVGAARRFVFIYRTLFALFCGILDSLFFSMFNSRGEREVTPFVWAIGDVPLFGADF